MILLQRFEEKYIPITESGCWIWIGHINEKGYGGFKKNGRWMKAHRASYEMFRGSIPSNTELDHLCRVRCCVNPYHLEAVTHKENCIRGIASIVNGNRQRSITHCPQGHVYDLENTYYTKNKERKCRKCNAIRVNKIYHKNKLKMFAPKQDKTP